MGLLARIFTWWNGASVGTSLFSWRNGERVGADALGNAYFQSKRGDRRWVLYEGANDASRIPPEWHSWLHRQIEGLPAAALPPAASFQRAATGNLTGTPGAYRPSGALERGGQRQAASGDYQAWTPN